MSENFGDRCPHPRGFSTRTKKLLGNRSFPASLTGRLHVWETLDPKVQSSNSKSELNNCKIGKALQDIQCQSVKAGMHVLHSFCFFDINN